VSASAPQALTASASKAALSTSQNHQEPWCLSQLLSMVIDELSFSLDNNVSGLDILHGLLNAQWLQSLVKVYECLHKFSKTRPAPTMSQASVLCREVRQKLALLSAHDSVAQKDYNPVLAPLPDNLPEDEEAMRIVCLVKNNQPLGATIKRQETAGSIVIARVIHGGLADRSGLLFPGDQLVEVNGTPVDGLEPEQVIQILVRSQGTIMFKLIPVSYRQISCSQNVIYVRAMADYRPGEDTSIPCVAAGLAFKRGDILQIVDRNDIHWWQAKNVSSPSICAGLIPSNTLLKRKQKEFWWSQSFPPHNCMKSTHCEYQRPQFCSVQVARISGFRKSARLCRRNSKSNQLLCNARSPDNCYSNSVWPYEEVVRYQRQANAKHRLVILVGPSGVGVNELRRRLIEINPHHFQSPVPHTTRPPKSHEEDGREYHFVSRESFEAMALSQRFLEYGEYKNHLYGTSTETVRSVLDAGKVCVIDLEPHRIYLTRTKELKPYIVFIKPPSISRLQQTRKYSRIITEYYVNRSFKDEDLEEMEDTAKKMEDHFGHLFDRVIVNDDLHLACGHLLSAVRQAQEEPHWVPEAWLCPDMDS
uniref:MAGUK p55 scaffold protein 4 n=1 Tax=Callorhinchus milii TaxID=7868 RepID=A0A4W3H601_CALMI